MNIENRVISTITNVLDMSNGDITKDSRINDMAIDSLDNVEIVMSIEEEFDIDMGEYDVCAINTVGDIVERVIKLIPNQAVTVENLLEQWKKQSLDTAYDDLNSFYSLKAVFEWVVDQQKRPKSTD